MFKLNILLPMIKPALMATSIKQYLVLNDFLIFISLHSTFHIIKRVI